MQQVIDTWYGSRFVDCNTITQFYYSGAGVMEPSANFFNIAPTEFEIHTQRYIVAVWHIKLKPAKPRLQLDMPPFITTFN
jgi:hypothetical protein